MGGWSTELCDCSNDCHIWLGAYVAPCIVAGMNANTLGKNPFGWGFLYCLCGPIFGAILRDEVRKEHSIEGDLCEDCMLHCCCIPCALRQEYTELRGGYKQLDMEH